jgi:hypothetical protein
VVSSLAHRVVGLYEEYLPPDTELPIRLTDSQQVLEVTRETLIARPDRNDSENSLEYDYEAIPYSPTENHRLIQLQKIQQYMPLLLQSPSVDKEKLIIKLLDLLQLQDILAPPPPPGPPQGAMPPGMPAAAMAPPSDTISTGALPPGAEVPIGPTPMGGPGYPALPGK